MSLDNNTNDLPRKDVPRSAPGNPATDRTLSSIPLSDPDLLASGEPSIGALVKDASAHVSTLLRSEVALAKAEVVGEAKKAVAGSVLFVIAGVILLYSSFFFFFFAGELLSEWIPRWAAFGLVFGAMVVFATLLGILGFLQVRKITGPKKTIASVRAVPDVLPTARTK